MQFQDYFSEEVIIRELRRAHIRHAAKRHDAEFFHNIARQSTRPTRQTGLHALTDQTADLVCFVNQDESGRHK
jgi:hypothetical protein